MGNRYFHKIERFHAFDMPECERFKVTALNLFHPTASPLLQKVGSFVLRHSLQGEGEGGDGEIVIGQTNKNLEV